MLKIGGDPISYGVRFCRENGLEYFYNIRMNDTHDGNDYAISEALRKTNYWKNAHPGCTVASNDERPPCGAFTALNYERDDVRDMIYNVLTEACRRYRIDGINLDFFRHPVFFRECAYGNAATEEQLSCMTSLVARIKLMADEESEKQGRKIYVTARVPDSAPLCKFIGLDIESWLSRGLLDGLLTASYLQLNYWDYSAALAHKYGVPVYPSLDEARIGGDIDRTDPANLLRCDAAGMRGRIKNTEYALCDGCCLFNFYDRDRKITRESVIAATQSDGTRRYMLSWRGKGSVAGGFIAHEKYMNIPYIAPNNPVKINGALDTEIYIGENAGRRALLRVFGGEARVYLNGRRLTEISGGFDASDRFTGGVNTLRFEGDFTLSDACVETE